MNQGEGKVPRIDVINADVSIAQLLQQLYGEWRVIAVFGLIAGLVGGIYAFSAPSKYKAEVILLPVVPAAEGGSLGGLSAAGSQLGGLASLAGLGPGSNSSRSEAVATLESRSLTEAYVDRSAILPTLFPRDWDASTKKWKSDNPDKQPSLWDANELFRKKIRTVTLDTQTGLVRLTIEWTDPKVAAQWANDLVDLTNATLRERCVETANRDVAYLQDQLQKTGVVELQRAISTLLESELKKSMIAQGSKEYAFKVIDPAVPPQRKSSPQRLLIISISVFFGALIGCLRIMLKKRVHGRDE